MTKSIEHVNQLSVYIDMPGQEAVEYHSETIPDLRTDVETDYVDGVCRVVVRVYVVGVNTKDNNVLF